MLKTNTKPTATAVKMQPNGGRLRNTVLVENFLQLERGLIIRADDAALSKTWSHFEADGVHPDKFEINFQ